MSGFEVFGAIGTAVAVIEAVIVTASYWKDFKNIKEEQKILDGHIFTFKGVISELRASIMGWCSSAPRKGDFESPLIVLLDNIETGLASITDYKAKNSGRIMWTFSKKRFQELWTNLERMKGLLTLALVGQTSDKMRTYCEENTNQYQAVVTELRQFAADHNAAMSDLKQHVTSNITPLAVGISKISRRLEGQEVREFRDWLTPDYFIEDELRELLSKCAYQSGEWLLNSGEMRRWLQEGTSRFFVVIGPAGCGKTILSSLVAQHIMKQDLVCLPVFIKFGANMDLTLILRRLLTSLIPFVDSSLPASLHQLRRCNSFNHCQLLEILNDISSSFSSPVYIILDALDEFNVLTRRDLLDLLSSLLNIKVFVTSRALPLFDELSAIKLDLVTSNLYDLNAFIEAEVTDIGRVLNSPSLEVKEMVQLVTAASCQLFLLASLHVRSLHQCQRRSTALKTARNLPRTARDHYALTIKRIKKRAILDVESSDAALACLLWVWKAKYPLFPVELSEAVASLMDDLTGVSAEPYLIPPSKLLDLCEGLLHIQEGVVTFSHFTVHEFFKDAEATLFSENSLSLSIFARGLPCLGTASLGFLNSLHSPECISILESFPYTWERNFLTYCAVFWGDHLSAQAVPAGIDILKASALFPLTALARRHYPFSDDALDRFMDLSSSGGITMTHTAASFNLIGYLRDSTEISTRDSEGRTPLHYACKRGHEQTVAHLLPLYSNPNVRDCQGRTPLGFAAKYGYLDIARHFLARPDIDIDSWDLYGRSPLLLACTRGHASVVAVLLARCDVNPNTKDKNGDFALSIACIRNDVEVVKLLVACETVAVNLTKHGHTSLHLTSNSGYLEVARCLFTRGDLDANILDPGGLSALLVAHRRDHLEVAKFLLSCSVVDPNILYQGHTLLFLASLRDQLDIVELLVSRNDVQVNISDEYGRTPLHLACSRGSLYVAATLLTCSETNVNVQDSAGDTPFVQAVKLGRQEIVELMLAHPMLRLDSPNFIGRSAIHEACIYGDTDVVNLLLRTRSFSLNSRDFDGLSPLHHACQCGHADIVEVLLAEADVDPNAQDKDGDTGLSLAVRSNYLEVVTLLISRTDVNINLSTKDGQSSLHWACQSKHVEIVKCLLTRNDINVNARDDLGWTPLFAACRWGYSDIVKLLLSMSSIRPNVQDDRRRSPLSLACNYGHLEIVDLLLVQNNIETSGLDRNGRSLVHEACRNGHVSVVERLLLEPGLRVDLRDKEGMVPLHHASEYGHLDMVKLLLGRKDCEPNVQDDHGCTPLSLARRHNHLEVVDFWCSNVTLSIQSYDTRSSIQHSS